MEKKGGGIDPFDVAWRELDAENENSFNVSDSARYKGLPQQVRAAAPVRSGATKKPRPDEEDGDLLLPSALGGVSAFLDG